MPLNLTPNFIETPLTAVIAGTSGAIGHALLAQLLNAHNVQRIYAVQRSAAVYEDPRVIAVQCDITQEVDLQTFSQRLKADSASVNCLINATGFLHGNDIRPEKALSQLSAASLQANFAVNAVAPILLLQAVLPNIGKQNPAWIVSLSARVGSIADNGLGGWYSYRAAKAAQNQLFKTASIELKRSHPLATCLQLHPGTVDSGLSKPFQSAVKADKLFTPEQSAKYLLSVIASKLPADTGTFCDWNNTAIPW
jgi:NAD(P)-dependent dehydrogenase (short-subunit alcohol dehydrogenase family)